MKPISLIIIIILFSALRNSSQAQALASEKPVESFYSGTTKRQLQENDRDRQPAARNARQDLSSQKALPQPSVPASVRTEKKTTKRKAARGKQQLASEKPVDMDRINKQRSLPKQ